MGLGRAESCELQLFEPSIELVHAKLLKRRERIILAPAPGSIKGVRLIDSLIRSPVVLEKNSVFEIGRVIVQAEIVDERSPLGEVFRTASTAATRCCKGTNMSDARNIESSDSSASSNSNAKPQ